MNEKYSEELGVLSVLDSSWKSCWRSETTFAADVHFLSVLSFSFHWC